MPRKKSLGQFAKHHFKNKAIEEISVRLSEAVASVEGRAVGAATKDIKDVFLKGAVVLRDEAKRLVPVKTGRLRDSLWAAKGDPEKTSALMGQNITKVPYAHLVEFGHGGPMPAPAHPFIRPAILSKKFEVQKIIENGFNAIIKRYLG